MNASLLYEEGEFERKLEARLVEIREERLARVSREARAWLALVPAWTDKLATACDFPSGDDGLKKFIQTAHQAGFMQSTGLEGDDAEAVHFWMPEGMRSVVLNDLQSAEAGRKNLIATAAEIGRRILAAKKNGVQTSTIVSCWAELAAITSLRVEEVTQFLMRKISELVLNENPATGEALAWLNAGKSLALTVGGSLESAIRVGEHRVELAYRKEQDERHLKHFLPRQDQIEAFKYLINNDDGVWALHYVGMGGVGKTMMLRHITARLAPELKAPTSRVDFDYLNPDYPVRLPGQLLLELATELRSYITNTRQEHLYTLFQTEAISLHEALSAAPPPDNPLNNIRCPGFKKLLNVFCDFLTLLSGPQVLILDTCEELAKVQLSGSKLPVLEATFEVIEQIYKRVKSVRFIFAGRRLLAKGGRGWRAGGSDDMTGRGYLPEQKDYLGLREIQGFEAKDANEYLSEIEGLTLDFALQEAIFARSRETGIVGKILWIPPRSQSALARYNPFDLSLYAEWVKADPNVEATTIKSGQIDPYVEHRIVQRIKNSNVQAIIPAVVLLRRFNKEMLLPSLAVTPDQFEEAYRELGDQEWIEQHRDEALEQPFLEINRHLYDRLYSYYAQSPRQSALEVASEALWPNLARLVRELPLRQLSTDHVDAALRLAPVADGAALWDNLNQRITNEGNWNWSEQVTGRILAEEGSVNRQEHPLRAAVLATHAAAMFHQNPNQDLTAVWQEVSRLASNHPDDRISQWLIRRATIKSLSGFRFDAQASAEARWKSFRDWITKLGTVFNYLGAEEPELLPSYHKEQLVACFCAAIETCLEQTSLEITWGLKPNDVINLNLPGQLSQVTTSPELIACAHALTGRALARKGRWGEARQLMDRAEELVTRAGANDLPPQRWEDWQAPALLKERIRLEVLTAIPPRIRTLPQQRLESWRAEATGHLDLIDAERLVSLILKRSLADALVPAAQLEAVNVVERYDLNRKTVCAAHRSVPPLTVSLALGWLALGRADKAMQDLNRRLEEALHTRADPETVRAVEIAKLQVIRRMRIQGRGTELINRMVRSQNADDVVRVRELLAVNSSTSPEDLLPLSDNSSPILLHAWWRGQVTLTPAMAREPLERMRLLAHKRIAGQSLSGEDGSAHFAHLQVDWQEACVLAKQFSLASLTNPDDFTFSAEDWWASHPTCTEEALRLVARTDALRSQSNLERRMKEQACRRLAAEMALEEGELLALRLPVQAAILLDQAYSLFSEVDDLVGALLAMQLSTIADIHSKAHERAKTRIVNNLLPLYDHLAKTNLDLKLPATVQLDVFLEDPTSDNAKKLDHSWLGGWLQRLVRCRVWMAETGNKGPRTAAVRDWLNQTYSDQLPIELAFGKEVELGKGGVLVAPSLRRLWNFTWPALGCTTIGAILFVLVIMTRFVHPCLSIPMMLMTFLTMRGVLTWIRDNRGIPIWQSVLSGIVLWFSLSFLFVLMLGIGDVFATGTQASSEGVSLLPVAVGLIGLIGLVILGYMLRTPIHSWLASRAEVTVKIMAESTGPPEQPDAAKTIPVAITLEQVPQIITWTRPFPHRRRTADLRENWELPALESYQKMAKDSPFRISDQFTRLNVSLGKHRLPVPLRIAPSLGFFPWEAVLSLALPKNDDLKLQFWRRADPLPSSDGLTQAEGVSVLGNETWGLMVENGWQPLTAHLSIDSYSVELDPGKPRRVLHLIGQPVDTTAGRRLRMSDRRVSGSTSSSSAYSPVSSSTGQTSETDVLLGTDSLPLSSSALVVLQAEPVDDLCPRLQTDRIEAGRLRAFADDIFAAGAQAVIVLPTLPPELAEKVLRILATGLAQRNQLDPVMLLHTVARIRGTIRDQNVYSSPTERETGVGASEQLREELRETRIELALDVCLYARSSFHR